MPTLEQYDPTQPAIGLAFLGQGQDRIDTSTERLYAELLPEHQIVPYGGLDGLTREEVSALEAEPLVGHPVIASLANGEKIVLSQDVWHGRLQTRINKVARLGLSTSVLLCTLDFDLQLPEGHTLIQPNGLTRGAVDSLRFRGPLGVAVPLEEQVSDAEARWRAEGQTNVIATALPVSETMAAVDRVAKFFSDREVGAIVLDCMGYDPDAQAGIREQTGVPTILPGMTVARAVQAMFR